MKIKIVNRSGNYPPSYSSIYSAGMDIRANLEEEIVLKLTERAIVNMGIYSELTVGYGSQINLRSGLAVKKGIPVLNTTGTIDSDYRGEVHVILINLSAENFVIKDGERICQMIIAKHEKAERIKVETPLEKERETGGFGPTGKN